MNIIKHFKLKNGRAPFAEWLKALRDPRAKTKIVRRIDQLALNNQATISRVALGFGKCVSPWLQNLLCARRQGDIPAVTRW